MRMKLTLILAMSIAWACVGVGPAALAAKHSEVWNLHTLMAAFAKRHFVKAKFHERKYIGVLNKPLDVDGKLVYRAPNTLEKRVESPVQESYEVKGDKVRIHKKGKTPRTFTLGDYPQLSGLIESIRAILKGDRNTLEHLYAVTLHGDRRHWSLRLKPKLGPLERHVRRIDMSGRRARIYRIITIKADGDRSIMDLEPIRVR